MPAFPGLAADGGELVRARDPLANVILRTLRDQLSKGFGNEASLQ